MQPTAHIARGPSPGTLTKGQFELRKLVPTGRHTRKDLHRWIAAVEVRDSHPIARSLVQSYTGCVVNFAGTDELPNVDAFKRCGRHGVMGTVDGHRVGVGDADFLQGTLEDPELTGAAADATERWEGGGRTVLYVTVDGSVDAVVVIEDTVKPSAEPTIGRLKALGIRPVLLTGDTQETAARTAAEVGIDRADVRAGLLPGDKARIVLEMSQVDMAQLRTPLLDAPTNESIDRGDKATRGPVSVGFVGDGLNDCAALASAHVGVVLQDVGSQAVVDAASAVLQVAEK